MNDERKLDELSRRVVLCLQGRFRVKEQVEMWNDVFEFIGYEPKLGVEDGEWTWDGSESEQSATDVILSDLYQCRGQGEFEQEQRMAIDKLRNHREAYQAANL